MPSTLISIRKSRPAAERVAIIEAVQAALVEAIKIPAGDRCVRLQTFEASDFIVSGQRTEDFTLVEVSMFLGRTMDAKRALYKTIVAKLGACGIAAQDVKIVLHEVPRENWGLRGGIPGSELELGFKVEV